MQLKSRFSSGFRYKKLTLDDCMPIPGARFGKRDLKTFPVLFVKIFCYFHGNLQGGGNAKIQYIQALMD